jgi:hypothetical protein
MALATKDKMTLVRTKGVEKNKRPREVESHAGNRSDETRTDAITYAAQ